MSMIDILKSENHNCWGVSASVDRHCNATIEGLLTLDISNCRKFGET
jgi:hypothetical protein